MKLSELSPAVGSSKAPKRKGRGHASGNGKTAGKGHKGQNARSGGGVRPGFEGGQMPLYRRLPKRGFTNIFRKEVEIVNVGDLIIFAAGDTVNADSLLEKGLIRGKADLVKLLGNGEIPLNLTVQLSRVSKSAQAKIEAAGGKVEGIE